MTPASSILEPNSDPAMYVAAVLTLYVDLPDCQCRNKTPAILPVLPIINLGGDAVSTLQ